ncbi:hypothetical protein [Paraflavitalea pollutisoli]|uniref:hypothetical protein n=1 Tax=Paraflavitalea pollutisoli TaxID=3034143 RepID=UPI0023EBE99F|nr:hypothetical protein [Paraflavitalea sp. H1-2-19X]
MKRWNVRSLIAATALAMLVGSTGCSKKDKDDPNNGGGKYPFYNTEYTGTAKVGNHYFPRPLSLRFGDDNSVSAFSHLILSKYHREFTGKITNVEKNGQGQYMVTILFDLPGEEQFNKAQVYTFTSDLLSLTGGSNPIVEIPNGTMKLFPKTSPSMVGTWAQPTQPGWYPDVNATVFFTQGTTNYFQGGKPVYFSYDDGVFFTERYKQDGSRITFAGVNTTTEPPKIWIIPYYGVLTADGKTLYVDSYESIARLPSSFSTFDWNGPKGVTPSLLRQ